MQQAPFKPGDIILGKYRMDRLLGMGSMGVVVAATHLGLGQQVAIKFMLANRMTHPELIERFLREARAAVKLQTPHVTRVSDVGTTEFGAPYLVMELLHGKDLEGVLEERGPLPYSEAVDYVFGKPARRWPKPITSTSFIATSSRRICSSRPSPVGPA